MENRIACSVTEAARAIGVCPNTIYKHIREGRLTATRVCGRRFVTVDSLKRLTGVAA